MTWRKRAPPLDSLHPTLARLGEILVASLDSIPDGVAILDKRATIVAVNEAWREFGRANGYVAPDSGIGTSYVDAVRAEDASTSRNGEEGTALAARRFIENVLAGRSQVAELEYPCHSPTEKRWFRMSVTRMELEGDCMALVRHENITASVVERREAERKMVLLRAIESSLSALTYQRTRGDSGWRYEFVAAAGTTFLGYRPEEIFGPSGLNVELLHADDTKGGSGTPIDAVASHGGDTAHVYRITSRTGETHWVRSITRPDTAAGVEKSAVGMLLDITEEIRSQQLVEEAHNFDALTHCHSRQFFEAELSARLRPATPRDAPAGIVAFDLDGFKDINAAYGHDVGDELLRQVSAVAQKAAREGDVVARLGPDTFGIISRGPPPGVAALAERLVTSLHRRFEISGHSVPTSISAGVSVADDPNDTSSDVVQGAATALDQAKISGGNTFRLHSKAMSADNLSRVTMKEQLTDAIEKQQFLLNYQPKISLKTGRVTGCEALIRWNHPVHGYQAPARFIPVAEKTGLIVPIGAWVIGEACRQSMEWLHAGVEIVPISVNVSAVQFARSNVLELIRQALSDTGADASAIHIEVTESVMVDYSEAFLEALEAIKAIGIAIELDDFGTGYSSLRYLKSLPLAALKVDQSFVRGALEDPRDAAIVHAVIQLAVNLGLETIGEGTETAAQVEFLRGAGCDQAQGYFFSPPLFANDFAWYVSTRNRARQT